MICNGIHTEKLILLSINLTRSYIREYWVCNGKCAVVISRFVAETINLVIKSVIL